MNQKLFLLLSLIAVSYTFILEEQNILTHQPFVQPALLENSLLSRSYNGLSVNNCGDTQQIFSANGSIWCGYNNSTAQRCYNAIRWNNTLVCGSCFGYCQGSVKVNVTCGAQVDICQSCWGSYDAIKC